MNFVIVVNYNNKKDSASCLNLLKRAKNVGIILVDNGSKDGSLEYLKKKFKRVVFIENKKNLGYSKANNIAIKYAMKRKARRVVLLNNDALLYPKDLKKLLLSKGDIVGPILKFKRGRKSFFDLGGHINWNFGRTYHKEITKRENIQKQKVDYLSGAVLVIKSKVFKKIGLLDKRYFLYFEDADFCTRAIKRKFKIELNTEVIVEHKISGSLGKRSLLVLFHNLRSNILFINKHLKSYRKILGIIYWTLLTLKVVYNWSATTISSKIKS